MSAGVIKVYDLDNGNLIKNITTGVDSMMAVHTGADNLFIFS